MSPFISPGILHIGNLIYPIRGAIDEWGPGHTNPTKSTPRDIATWEDASLLSPMIDGGSYERKALPGSWLPSGCVAHRRSLHLRHLLPPEPCIRPTKKAKGEAEFIIISHQVFIQND